MGNKPLLKVDSKVDIFQCPTLYSSLLTLVDIQAVFLSAQLTSGGERN